MIAFRFKHVRIQSYAIHLPPTEVTSAAIENRLSALYKRLEIPAGTLEKLSGIKSRHLWDAKVLPSEVGTVAASKALDASGFDRADIGALFSCSVTRDYFEPATGCLIHRNLELGEQSIALDISNACIGFSDGLLMMGNLIETGIIRAGIVVSGESVGRIVENNIELLAKDETLTRDDMLQLLPTLTLGSGAVAYVLCHDSMATSSHKLIGGSLRSATQFNDLCSGNADHCIGDAGSTAALMRTESSKIIASASKLGGRLWPDASEVLQWTANDIDHIFCHQVGRQVNDNFYKEMGLDIQKEYTIYRKYGNLVSAAMPTALVMGVEEKPVNQGEKILCTAFGSGLNCIFLGIEW